MRGKLEVIRSERLRLVVYNLVNFVLITIAVRIIVNPSIRCLTLHGEDELEIAFLGDVLCKCRSLVLQVVESELRPLSVHPVVVVCARTEGVETRTMTRFDDSCPIISCRIKTTGVLVESEFVALSFHAEQIAFHHRCSHTTLRHTCHCRLCSSRLHRDLFFHLHITLLSPRLLFGLEELHFEEVFL